MSRDRDERFTRRDLLLLLGATSLSGTAAVGIDQLMTEESTVSDGPTESSVAFVLRAGDGSGYRAVTLSEELGRFSAAERAFEALFERMDSGSVFTGGGRYRLESPLDVPEGFRVSNTADGMFVNALSDNETKCVRFAPNTGSDYLKVDCGKKDGVLLGTTNAGNDIDVWYADIHRAGTNAQSQAAIKVRGSGVKIFHASVYRGTRGILLEGAYDVHIVSAIVANSGVGLRLDGVRHCFFDQIDFDSCRNYAARIDDASGIRLNGLVWNNTDFDAWPFRGVEIGANRPCDNVYTDVAHLSNPGAALYVDRVEASHLHHDVTEADGSWYEYKSGITTTQRTAESCLVEGYVAPSIDNAVTNLRGGTFRIVGAGTNRGTHAASGDGSKTAFRIPHGLGTTPDRTRIQPRSRAAAGNFYVRGTDGSNITVEYTSPPAAGNQNLVWAFDASV